MKKTFIISLLVLSAIFTWLAWQPPQAAHTQHTASGKITPPEIVTPGIWRVISKRITWKGAVENMRARLDDMDLKAKLIKTRELSELHAFDDLQTFKTHKAAKKIQKNWVKAGIKAEVQKAKTNKKHYIVSLGRFSNTSYAEKMQATLKNIGKPYHYERRMLEIPAFRFIFPEMKHQQAKKLWQKLQNIGVVSPVLMQKERFDSLFGANARKKPSKK